jgi:hypothetical protein
VEGLSVANEKAIEAAAMQAIELAIECAVVPTHVVQVIVWRTCSDCGRALKPRAMGRHRGSLRCRVLADVKRLRAEGWQALSTADPLHHAALSVGAYHWGPDVGRRYPPSTGGPDRCFTPRGGLWVPAWIELLRPYIERRMGRMPDPLGEGYQPGEGLPGKPGYKPRRYATAFRAWRRKYKALAAPWIAKGEHHPDVEWLRVALALRGESNG